MLAAVQEDLEEAVTLRQQLEVASASSQARATAAEERATRLERENRQAADRLHRQVSLLLHTMNLSPILHCTLW